MSGARHLACDYAITAVSPCSSPPRTFRSVPGSEELEEAAVFAGYTSLGIGAFPPLNFPLRIQLCIAKCFYSFTGDLLEFQVKTTTG